MKMNKFFAVSLLCLSVGFTACDEPEIGGGDNTTNPSDTTEVSNIVTIPSTPTLNIPEGTLTVSEARDLCATLSDKGVTSDQYYVKGWVKRLDQGNTTAIENYGNALFYLAEEQYTDGTFSEDEFYAFQVFNLDQKKFFSAEQIQVGDYVVIRGNLTNYNGIYETTGKGAAYVYSNSRDISTILPPEKPELGPNDTATVAQARLLQDNSVHWVKGYIVGYILTSSSGNVPFFRAPEGSDGATTYNVIIADDVNETSSSKILCIQVSDGKMRQAINLRDNPDNIGKMMAVKGNLTKYSGFPGLKNPIGVMLDGFDVLHPFDAEPEGALYYWTFDGDYESDKYGEFTLDVLNAGSYPGELWHGDGTFGCVQGAAYDFNSKNSYTGSARLVSPVLDITASAKPVMSFLHAVGNGVPDKNLEVLVSTDGETWTNINSLVTWPEGNANSTYVSSGEIDLTSYKSSTFQVAFSYTAKSSPALIWNLRTLLIK
ncbi:MAG: DUF5017 domain-containing protein [Paludibacter sp.]|nr:DUF5017 domain-containing protein [Bacteroidales bacterium]MCM1068865.1 DUF5017 domain-containing protein [Prevotella sp.]MCM1353126.1 DUF5017 domain-containing protein [Bacteroides sp.]MCM1442448.1 DUF5017 domain-containing protein [Muribaculum sp.]MCM1481291.1 DUF5017 domain-containing protein [Paludibacter sp.]